MHYLSRLPLRSVPVALVAACATLELVGFNWYECAVVATVFAAGLYQIAAELPARDPNMRACARVVRR